MFETFAKNDTVGWWENRNALRWRSDEAIPDCPQPPRYDPLNRSCIVNSQRYDKRRGILTHPGRDWATPVKKNLTKRCWLWAKSGFQINCLGRSVVQLKKKNVGLQTGVFRWSWTGRAFEADASCCWEKVWGLQMGHGTVPEGEGQWVIYCFQDFRPIYSLSLSLCMSDCLCLSVCLSVCLVAWLPCSTVTRNFCFVCLHFRR